MLYNPKWDRNPSLVGFALFVESKDPNEAYNWYNCGTCAVGQYLASIDRKETPWTGQIGTANILARGDFKLDSRSGWTFGKLAERIRAFERQGAGMLACLGE